MLELRLDFVWIQKSLHHPLLNINLYLGTHVGEFVRTIECRDGKGKIDCQGNIYQDTDAQFRMLFAVEITPTGKIIKTGDDAIKVSPFYIGMAVSGLAFMALAVDGFLQRKKKGGESK